MAGMPQCEGNTGVTRSLRILPRVSERINQNQTEGGTVHRDSKDIKGGDLLLCEPRKRAQLQEGEAGGFVLQKML